MATKKITVTVETSVGKLYGNKTLVLLPNIIIDTEYGFMIAAGWLFWAAGICFKREK